MLQTAASQDRSEKTKVGRELSGALVATLVGMFMANTGLLPAGAPELDIVYKYLLPLAIPMLLMSADLNAQELVVVYKYLLPLAIPMLLMSADLKRILAETGRILAAFLLGSFCTVAGSLLAYYIIPLGPHFGVDGWKIAAALTARHIGGAVNYMAVADSNHLSASVFGAGLAADDLILTIYFTSIFSLAKSILSDKEKASLENKVPLLDEVAQPSTSKSLILEAWGIQGHTITLITALTVILATAVPKLMNPIVPSAQGMARILMQIFCAAIGASANVELVVRTAPILFLFSAVALTGHVVLILGLGKLLGFTRQEILLASNANIGGPSTVAGLATAKGWTTLMVPSILVSTLGYAIGTFVGMFVGHVGLSKMG
eukprot:gene30420-35425_t